MPMTCESVFFKKHELQCNHCGRCEMDDAFLGKLDILRYAYGKPIYLTSAYRCPEYNDKISKTGANGPHTTGKAVDIRVYGTNAAELLKHACNIGFMGLGFSQKGDHKQRFIHIDDIDSELRPWIFSY